MDTYIASKVQIFTYERYGTHITCLCVSPLSFHIEILLCQHGRSALDTSRTLFLLASTHGVLQIGDESLAIYVYVLFSCLSVPAPQLLIFHREYLVCCIVVVYQS